MRRIQKENVSAQGKGGQRFVGMGKRGARHEMTVKMKMKMEMGRRGLAR
jgi:hypothetical protein